MCFRILEGKLAAFKTAEDFPTHTVRTYDLCADEVATQALLEGPPLQSELEKALRRQKALDLP
jgi:hypothetical protein